MKQKTKTRKVKAWAELYIPTGVFKDIFFSREEAENFHRSSNPVWLKNSKVVSLTITYHE